MSPVATSVFLRARLLQHKLRQLSPDSLHYVRHGIADESERELVALICENADILVGLLAQLDNKPK